MDREDPLWAIIPAAGYGARFGGETPKQYLPLSGRTVIEWAISPFLRRPGIAGIAVVLAPGDERWGELAPATDRVFAVTGGDERARSVLNGLLALRRRAGPRDWVLVHDAARPCLTDEDLQRLIETVRLDEVGGLLAVPARDTLKRSEGERVRETIDRRVIWQALTPQMFRLGPLIDALEAARASGAAVTDESSAMELAGARPRLVAGRGDNIKVTRPEDLPLAEFILGQTGLT
jgi:2-C-methyl-D-erythritol 4-phosphate cytidylyltransferase